ncbi:type II secretion system protein GspM [Rhizobacter sp. Root1221]|uniref:type II secretion system protein GspM n=1 Tax=Rhizobacter sp. Root1221 TaxID=1736433 RepID=UPI0006FC9184|nr:type II secretion system protein GspM [Rhizobacter sp. Root1221]KQW02620.1 general secretion pathway protein GspM [Rhizobacter sp. Root1221]
MSDKRSIQLPPALALASKQAGERWRALGERERLGATIAAALIGVWIVWAVTVQPAWRTIREAPAQIDALDAQLQAMQRMAAETRELRAVSPVSPVQQQEALKAATDRLGAEKARLTVQGDRATLTLTGVTGEQLRRWLGEARSGARARPVETQLTRGAEGYAGTLTLTLGSTS